MPKGKAMPVGKKEEIMQYAESKGVDQAAEKYNVSRGTIYKWRSLEREAQKDVFIPQKTVAPIVGTSSIGSDRLVIICSVSALPEVLATLK
jgi:transposase-like protein